jgi:hypothetical protein
MAGYSMHVSKPIEPDHLISVVETLAVPARGGARLVTGGDVENRTRQPFEGS